MSAHATQLHFEPMGAGRVGLFAVRGELADPAEVGRETMIERKLIEMLAYPQQGTMVGAPPRDEQNAARLNEAVAELNDVLAELAS